MKKLLISILFVVLTFATSLSSAGQKLSPPEIMEKYGNAVVLIASQKNDKEFGLGSGFIVKSDGVIVTNYHVIEGASPVVVKLKNGDIYEDVLLIDCNEREDIAVLKIKGFDLPSVNLGNSNNVRVGERVIVIGNPHGLENTISDGLLSQMRDTGQGYKLHQISAPISPGSSGSPVFNLCGEVIGIATLSDVLWQNLNFSVPINYARPLIETKKEPVRLSETRMTKKTETTEEDIKTPYDGICPYCKSKISVYLKKDDNICPNCKRQVDAIKALQPIKEVDVNKKSIAFIQMQTENNVNNVGLINLGKVFDEYCKTKEADKKLEKISNEREKERLRKIREGASVEEIKALVEKVQASLNEMRDEAVIAIVKDIDKVLQKYGQDNNYCLIINDRALIVPEKASDITKDIIKILNQK